MDPVSKSLGNTLPTRSSSEKSGESSKVLERPTELAGVPIQSGPNTDRLFPPVLRIEQVQPSQGAAFSGPAVVPDEAAAGSATDSSSMIEESGEDGDSRLRNSLVSRGCGLSYILEKDNVTLDDIFQAQQGGYMSASVLKVFCNFRFFGIQVQDDGEGIRFSYGVSDSDIQGLAQLEIDSVGFSDISNELLQKFFVNESKKTAEGKPTITTIEFANELCRANEYFFIILFKC